MQFSVSHALTHIHPFLEQLGALRGSSEEGERMPAPRSLPGHGHCRPHGRGWLSLGEAGFLGHWHGPKDGREVTTYREKSKKRAGE